MRGKYTILELLKDGYVKASSLDNFPFDMVCRRLDLARALCLSPSFPISARSEESPERGSEMATPALPLDDDNDVSFPTCSSLPPFPLFPQRPQTLTLRTISPPQEFDWEAAVREIDDACQLASASTSTSNPQGFATPVATAGAPANLWRRGGEGRQSTLDRFVVDFHGTKRTRNDDGNRFGSRGREAKEEQNLVGGDEQLAVDIDLEAAKTWIYPGRIQWIFSANQSCSMQLLLFCHFCESVISLTPYAIES